MFDADRQRFTMQQHARAAIHIQVSARGIGHRTVRGLLRASWSASRGAELRERLPLCLRACACAVGRRDLRGACEHGWLRGACGSAERPAAYKRHGGAVPRNRSRAR